MVSQFGGRVIKEALLLISLFKLKVRQGQGPVEKGEGWPEFGQVELTLYFVQIDEWGQTVS